MKTISSPRFAFCLLPFAFSVIPLCAAEIRIPVDRQSRPVAEAVARSNAMPHHGKERIEATITLGKRAHPLKASPNGAALDED